MKIAKMIFTLSQIATAEANYSSETFHSFQEIFESLYFVYADINASMREISFTDGSRLGWNYLSDATPCGSFYEI